MNGAKRRSPCRLSESARGVPCGDSTCAGFVKGWDTEPSSYASRTGNAATVTWLRSQYVAYLVADLFVILCFYLLLILITYCNYYKPT